LKTKTERKRFSFHQMETMIKSTPFTSHAWPGATQTSGLVSVIIPVLNRSSLLPLTLDSIFAQPYRPVEVVIVDDGSTDASPEIAEKWAAAHNGNADFTICVLRRQHQGASSARNAGALQSQGEFIQFFDSDDLMRPEKIAKSVQALQAQPDLDFIASDFARFRERKNGTTVIKSDLQYSRLEHTPEKHADQNCLDTEAPLFRRTSLAAVGQWAEDLSLGEDFEYMFRVLSVLRGHWLPEILYDVRETAYSVSSRELQKGSKTWADQYIQAYERIEKNAQLLGIPQEPISRALGRRLQKNALTLAKRKQWDSYDAITTAALHRIGSVQGCLLAFKKCWLRLRGKFRPFIDYKKIAIQVLKRIGKNVPKKYRPKIGLQIKLLETGMPQISKRKIRHQIHKLGNFSGITDCRRETPLVVSLTTFPARMDDAYYAIFSLMRQSIKPDAIVLWLTDEECPRHEQDVSAPLLSLREHGLTIKFAKNLKPYNKLVYSLREYPNAVVATADDDIYYSKDWLEKLYESYLETPVNIHCHRAHGVRFDSTGKILPYAQWRLQMPWQETIPSFLNFITGVGGVLYPPHCLHEDAFNEELFLRLSPTNDDIWFWVMAILKGTKIEVVRNNEPHTVGINPARDLGRNQETALFKVNRHKNDEQVQAVLDHYGLTPILWETFQKETPVQYRA
jgi:glycosyltransferase involved in cell wall biosynthesis